LREKNVGDIARVDGLSRGYDEGGEGLTELSVSDSVNPRVRLYEFDDEVGVEGVVEVEVDGHEVGYESIERDRNGDMRNERWVVKASQTRS